jgi:hypothetical protein
MHIITYKEKVYAYQENEERVAIHKKIRKKLGVKDGGDFLYYLLAKNGFVKIKKFEYGVDKAINRQKS